MPGMSIQQRIADKLTAALAPAHLEVENESHRHNTPPGAESHFKITVVAAAFAGQAPLARHRRIYRLLAEELDGPVHALALHALSDDEWLQDPVAPGSPPCRGGDGGRD